MRVLWNHLEWPIEEQVAFVEYARERRATTSSQQLHQIQHDIDATTIRIAEILAESVCEGMTSRSEVQRRRLQAEGLLEIYGRVSAEMEEQVEQRLAARRALESSSGPDSS